MEPKKMSTSLLLFIAIVLSNSVTSDRLTDFVTQKLENYTTWLKTNNMDPTPVNTGSSPASTSNFLFKLDNELRNYYVQGHSNNLQITYVFGELLHGYFTTRYRLVDNITIYGEHITNGTMLSLTPITGQGSWRVTVPNVEYTCLVDFELLPSGYLSITRQSASTYAFDIGELYFENLSDNEVITGYEEYFQETIYNTFLQVWDRVDPLPEYCIKYWSEIIPETTLADIHDITKK